MNLQTISMVSKNFNISTRTLRYYEQIGLLRSVKKDGYAYRTYDQASLDRLEQIIILRKLRIPLKQIQLVLQGGESSVALNIFQEKIKELSEDINALSTIRSVLNEFVNRLRQNFDVNINPMLLTNSSLQKIIDSLAISKIDFKEDFSMSDLDNVEKNQAKLADVRIIYLPPLTVAAAQFYCDEPERHASEVIDRFVKESGLAGLKPDLRHFGFNNPSFEQPPEGEPDHGYEMWVTIPENFEVPAPLTKKSFPGGLYAAHMIRMGDFHEWKWLYVWVMNNDTYEPEWGEPLCMNGLLEEHINYYTDVTAEGYNNDDIQLDLLFPIKAKSK